MMVEQESWVKLQMEQESKTQQSFSMEKVNDAMNGDDNDNINDNKRKMVNGDDGSKLV